MAAQIASGLPQVRLPRAVPLKDLNYIAGHGLHSGGRSTRIRCQDRQHWGSDLSRGLTSSARVRRHEFG